jgi:tape measure domain-containing protein
VAETVEIILQAEDRASQVLNQVRASLQGLATSALQPVHEKVQAISGSLLALGRAGMAVGAGLAAFEVLKGTLEGLHHVIVEENQALDRAAIAWRSIFGETEEVSGSLERLQALEERIGVDFGRFLEPAARRLAIMGLSARDAAVMVEDIARAAAVTGGGEESFLRISAALGRVAEMGRVSAFSFRMLLSEGIPAVDMLAEHLGVSRAEVMRLAQEGKITSDVLLRAFHEWAQTRWGDALAQQTQTFTGALGRLREAVEARVSEAFRPLFEAGKNVANALANFFSSDLARQISQGIARAFEAAGSVLQAVFNVIRPILEGGLVALRTLFQGDLSRAFLLVIAAVEETLENIVRAVLSTAQRLFGGGFQMMVSLAQGIIQGAVTVVQTAVNFVARLVASFLIGRSPPEQGPLARIVEGGRALIEAWVQGILQGDISPVREVAAEVMEVLTGAEEEVQALTQFMSELDAQVRELDTSLGMVNLQLSQLALAAAQVRAAYEPQIEAIQEQLDALRDAVDISLRIRDLELELSEIELRRQLIQLQLARGLEDEGEVRRKLNEAAQNLLAAQIEEAGIRRALAVPGLAEAERARLQSRLQQVVAERGIYEQQRAQLEAQLRQVQLFQEQERAIRAQMQRLQLERELVQLAIREQEVRARIAALPLEAQLRQLQREMQAQLRPLEEQRRVLELQRQQLDIQRQVLHLIQQAWQPVVEQARELNRQLEKAARGARAALPEVGPAKLDLGLEAPPMETVGNAVDRLLDEAERRLQARVERLQASLMGMFALPDIGRLLEGFTTGLTVLGERLGPALGRLGQEFTRLAAFVGRSFENLLSTVTPILEVLAEKAGEVARLIYHHFREILPLLVELVTAIIGRVVDTFEFLDQTLGPMVRAIWSTVVDVTRHLLSVVLTVVVNTLDTLLTTFKVILLLLTGHWQEAWQEIENLLRRTSARLEAEVERLRAALVELFQRLSEAVKGLWNGMLSFLQDKFNGFVAGVRSTIDGLIAAVNDLLSRIAGIRLPSLPGGTPAGGEPATGSSEGPPGPFQFGLPGVYVPMRPLAAGGVTVVFDRPVIAGPAGMEWLVDQVVDVLSRRVTVRSAYTVWR